MVYDQLNVKTIKFDFCRTVFICYCCLSLPLTFFVRPSIVKEVTMFTQKTYTVSIFVKAIIEPKHSPKEIRRT